MAITVFYYAVIREVTGVSEESIELADGSNGLTLLAKIVERHPGIAPFVPTLRLATETSYIKSTDEIESDSTIFLIPPVSGG